MKRKRGPVLFGLAAALAGAAAVITAGIIPGTSVTADVPEKLIPPRYTILDFQRLREGMTYDDAARTLGNPGHEVLKGTPEYIRDFPTDADVYLWPSPNGSRIVLVFLEDRLIQRHQVGLR